jgi:hypothetical protein
MEEISVAKGRAKYTGIFDFGDYYRMLYDLFTSMGYSVEEQKYAHKSVPTGDEIEIEWNCYKKVDDYSLFRIFAKTLVLGLQKVKVVVEGVQTTKNQGSLELELKCFVQTDYENRWETSPILKFLKGIYDAYFYKATLDNWKEKVAADMHTVENEVKAFFHMQRFM